MNDPESVGASAVPTLVEVWAPHCGECRRMAPDLAAVAEEFTGTVELIRIDAWSEPESTAGLGVRATPTLIGFRDGSEVYRATGRHSPQQLRSVFASLASGTRPAPPSRRGDAVLRLVAGAVLTVVGAATGPSVPLLVAGGAILAWACWPFLGRDRAARS